MMMPLLWAAVIILAVVIEAASVQLLSIWFALGGLVSLILSLFKVSESIQVIVFVAVSIVSIILFWPLARRFNKKTHDRTNADRYIGKTGIVTERISNIDAAGAVKVDNQIWTARSENNSAIEQGAAVKVERIEGVKLIVSVLE